MVEHAAWVGPNYSDGILGQKVAIVGYSHWGDSPDHDGFTWQCVANVRDNVWPDLRFFNSIQNYFGFHDRMAFWNTAMFFNFVPNFVGDRHHKYLWATPEQKLLGQIRVKRLVEVHRPDKMLVFSRKSWSSFPMTLQEEGGLDCAPLGNGCAPAFTFGTYQHSSGQDTPTIAVGLRHPQFANTAQMQAAVSTAMALVA